MISRQPLSLSLPPSLSPVFLFPQLASISILSLHPLPGSFAHAYACKWKHRISRLDQNKLIILSQIFLSFARSYNSNGSLTLPNLPDATWKQPDLFGCRVYLLRNNYLLAILLLKNVAVQFLAPSLLCPFKPEAS